MFPEQPLSKHQIAPNYTAAQVIGRLFHAFTKCVYVCMLMCEVTHMKTERQTIQLPKNVVARLKATPECQAGVSLSRIATEACLRYLESPIGWGAVKKSKAQMEADAVVLESTSLIRHLSGNPQRKSK